MVGSPLARPAQNVLARKVYLRFALAVPVLGAIIFLPAGTLAFGEAWLYLAVLLIPMSIVFSYLLRHDPELLARRLQAREKETAQRRIMSLSLLYVLLIFMLPGFDRRWGWSSVSWPVVLAADLVVMLGYTLFILVLRENRYAARTIRVEEGQRVISTGPYAIVRHPMYLGMLLMYLASPVALGSYWAFVPALLIVPILVARILNEERVLERDLNGYIEYKQATKYRLIPGLW